METNLASKFAHYVVKFALWCRCVFYNFLSVVVHRNYYEDVSSPLAPPQAGNPFRASVTTASPEFTEVPQGGLAGIGIVNFMS